jgi:hypothetical protein
MATQGPRGRLLRYLYSDKNLAGCGAGLVGLALYFAGVVDALWPLVVAALYAAGALLAPPAKPAVVDLHLGVDLDDLTETMRAQAGRLTGEVPPDVLAAVERVHDVVREIVARSEQLPAGSPSAFTVRQTVADYLPGALEPYLRLPRRYADRAALRDGRTAKGILLDQLTVLQTELNEVLEDLARGDTDRLLAHERFLADRFGRSELDELDELDEPTVSPPGEPEDRRPPAE